ncbi:hypothetical protein [Bacillus subtilis]|uniref:hypothetical protein n=1 Tax=Bacillus subtilis TaxID=1423 RepID=UPI0004E45164|nr:hypothetical protein [Bacillus subtilis]KFC30856.1 hypothetical protein ZQL_09555 [Bacillus subtilis]WLD60332.1 hypothetical protein PIB33_14085 [Bacillus subtilis]
MLFIFKHIDEVSIKSFLTILKFQKNSSNKLNEFKDLEFSSEFIRCTFVKSFDSYELIYDDSSECLVTKKFSRMYSAQVFISTKMNYLIIYGEKTVCLSAEKILNEKLKYTPKPWEFSLYDIYTKFSDLDIVINEVKFSNVKLLNTLLKAMTLEFENNFDALKIIQDLNYPPVFMRLKIFYQDDICDLSVSIELGHIELKYESFSKVVFDNLEEKILNLIEGA